MIPSDDNLVDAAFVCIDFEFSADEIITEVGIATLDTQELQNPDIISLLSSTTQNYRLGEKARRHRPQGCRRGKNGQSHDANHFTWVETKYILPNKMKELIMRNIQQASASGEQRNVILVLHSFQGDMTLPYFTLPRPSTHKSSCCWQRCNLYPQSALHASMNPISGPEY